MNFLKKNQLVVTRLARDLLLANIDDRVQPISTYAEQLDVSQGTVQKAMQFLISNRCVAIQFRGHLGSYITTKNNAKLWGYTGFGTLSGSMPLPLTLLPAGLATGICDCMRTENISYNCVFMQGSNTRLKGLTQGRYDFIVASRLTEQLILKEYDRVESVMDLPGCLYSKRYVLLLKDPSYTQVEDGMTIAVDPTSIDQQYLTQQLCKGKKNIRFNELTYLDTHYSVKRGESDVTVSRLDSIEASREFRDMNVRQLSISEFSQKEIDNWGSAVILARKGNYGLPELLRKTLHSSVVADAQQQVMQRLRTPSYF